jgi:D-3-phosphoglycerate dehydrogenase
MKNLKDCRVLVAATSFGRYDARMRTELEAAVGEVIYNATGKPMTSDELVRALPGLDGIIAGLDYLDRPAIESADQLRVIARYGVGLDRVDLDAARQKGIVVTYTPGANSSSVAELTLGVMLALARHIYEAASCTCRGEWPRVTGFSLEGKTVGLVGFGAIGRHVAKLLSGFGCRVIATDVYFDAKAGAELNVQQVDLPTLLKEADIVSLHTPALPETNQMVNDDFLAQMKPGALLVNTARGELIDEAALLRALQSGRLGGAALDAFSEEPPCKDNPLLQQKNLILTPHIGAHTDGAANAMGWGALHDCLAVLRGEEPQHRVA